MPDTALPDPELLPEFYRYVPFKRLVAWVIDTLLILLLTLVVVPFTAFTAVFFLPLLYVALNLGYRTVGLARWSATPGMWVMAIELRHLSGHRLDPGNAFLHSLGYTVSVLIPFLQVVSICLMLVTPRGQGLTDHILKTAALNRPAAH